MVNPDRHSVLFIGTLFCPGTDLCVLCLMHIFKAFQTRAFMEANSMNPDQSAPLRPIEMRANIL